MARRDFITPPDLPTETIGRCVQIPASQEWLGLLNSALLFLTQDWRYEQISDESMTPAECAAAGMLIYEAYLEANCMDCNDCFTGDFGLDDDLMYRVEDDVPQFSADGGTTWSDLPPGGGTSPNVPALTATPGADEEAKACLAATRATLTLASLYQQTAGKAAVDLYSAFTTMAQFLSDVNRALFRLIWPDYFAVVNAVGLFDCAACEGYLLSEPTLDSDAQDTLRCLLYENASVSAGGVVTFDFNAVQDNLISELGVNPGTALFFLLAYLGGDGLNRAGNVAVTDDALFCCGTWCYEWDFSTGTLGWTQGTGRYVAGVGYSSNFSGSDNVEINSPVGFDATHFTSIEFHFFTTWTGIDTRILIRDVAKVTTYANSGANGEAIIIVPIDADEARLNFNLDRNAGATQYWTDPSNYLQKIVMRGTGVNPFGEDNCL